MKTNQSLGLAAALLSIAFAGRAAGDDEKPRPHLTLEAKLGRAIFFDEDLSIHRNQSCAACHSPGAGWTGTLPEINAHGAVYEGSIPGRFGNRKPPSAAYATTSPILHYVDDEGEALFIGGNFWDGRATGESLKNPAADQALGPFLNPVEQALPDPACVVFRVCNATGYPGLLEVVRPGACDIAWPTDVEDECAQVDGAVDLTPGDRRNVTIAYDYIGLAIAEYEASPDVNRYSSKFDSYLAGRARLSPQERKGLALFTGKGLCANCHVLDPGPSGAPPQLTDFTFDNLGVPKNPENPWYSAPPALNPDGANWVDLGLGGFLTSRAEFAEFAAENEGKHKVPTLRNVDKRPRRDFVKAYMHNGVFKGLKQVVHFYNTRDVLPDCADVAAPRFGVNCWPTPEVPQNVNTEEAGNLGLTDAEEDAIVAFLKTLSDSP